MTRRALLPLVLLAALTGTASIGAQAPRVLDLGHPLGENTPSWSGGDVYSRRGTPRSGSISTDEHHGTHVDAPSHFGGTWTVDQIPAERLVRPGLCINVTGRPEDYRITAADIESFEARHGRIPEGSVVFFATGWDARWPDRRTYINERAGVKHFPGLGTDAAAALKERRVAGIGIDTPSVDYGPSTAFEVHTITNGANIYHIENATNLTRLPPTGFTVVVAPIRIAGGSGGPARVLALLP